MAKKIKINYAALECLECRTISVFPSHISDGSTCLNCGGYTKPIGNAIVKGKGKYKIEASISIDTTEIDQALEKFREMERIHNKLMEEGGGAVEKVLLKNSTPLA